LSRIKFLGVRSSIPVCNEEFRKFGGNTTYILQEGPKRTVILDAGTGIREPRKEMAQDPHLDIDRPRFLAFSHFHWDPIQGLPFLSLPMIHGGRSPSVRSAESVAVRTCEASLKSRCRKTTFRSVSTIGGQN
jgi:phosphoribosyl 1,2-cyclic phosphodiesterase